VNPACKLLVRIVRCRNNSLRSKQNFIPTLARRLSTRLALKCVGVFSCLRLPWPAICTDGHLPEAMISNVIILGRSTFAFGPKLVRMILASCLIGIGQTIAAPRLETEQTNKQSFNLSPQLVIGNSFVGWIQTFAGIYCGEEREAEAEAEQQNHRLVFSASHWSPRLRRTANHRLWLWLWLWLPLRNHSPSCGAERSGLGASLVHRKSGTRLNVPSRLDAWARGEEKT
jgi:hypothetical protein